MQKLSDLTSKRLHQHKLAESAQASLVIHLANEKLQKDFEPDQVKALSVKNGILKIATAGAVYNQELWGMQDELLAELQKACGPKSVLKIRTTLIASND